MGGLVLGILRACVVVYGILGWVTVASAQFTAESLSDDDITQAIALLIEETMEDWLQSAWQGVHNNSIPRQGRRPIVQHL